MRFLMLALLIWPHAGFGESLVATRLIRATEVIAEGDVTRQPQAVSGAAHHPDQVIGLEARVALYPGRPIKLADLGPAAVVERNDIVRMVYRRGGLVILFGVRAGGGGRAGAGLGDTITVMNLGSRQSVQGVVTTAGLVEVTGSSGAME
ncbi:MAG: flagellar basal body P-ring formation protein FlgA [Rhodobacteraceae bacterium]|nr:flagellar basal body P-ring formation protein FlgA [Paracoccaceae bacterium]